MIPLGRGREKSVSGVFFTVPCAVAMNTKWFSSNSFTGTTAVIFSLSSSGNMLTIGLPRLERLPAGTPETLLHQGRPRLVEQKQESGGWATEKGPMKAAPLLVGGHFPPPPPLFARESVCGVGFT